MSFYIFIGGAIAIIAIIAIMAFLYGRPKPLTEAQKQKTLKLIDQGVLYEDEFIAKYFTILRNQGYMYTFGGYEKQAHDLLYKMIQESEAHKAALIKIKKHLKI